MGLCTEMGSGAIHREVEKAGANQLGGGVGGNLKICFEHNEFTADQVSR